MTEEEKAKWMQEQIAQAKLQQDYKDRLRDLPKKEAWMLEQYQSADDMQDYNSYVEWMSANTEQLDSAWRKHCEPPTVATLESDESCCG